jgi:cytochrome c oxidase subunit 3
MADAHAKPQHDYHLVEPSPWPALGSVSAFVAAVGGITWMHHMFPAAPYIFGVGVIGILYTMLGWWTDVAREATHEGYHTQVVQISHRYGMILFIASEVMFFVAWFWAYFNSALFPADMHQITREQLFGGVWPPQGIETFDPWHLPLLNTLILLTSGTTVTWAHHALLENDRQGLKWGFHGFHVIIGTTFLIVCLIRAYLGHFTPTQHLGFEFAAWYWHFVDVVWIFLFACIYVWGSGGEGAAHAAGH